jgi:hypothetical protein
VPPPFWRLKNVEQIFSSIFSACGLLLGELVDFFEYLFGFSLLLGELVDFIEYLSSTVFHA